MSNDDFLSGAVELGMEAKTAVDVLRVLTMSTPFENPTTQLFLSEQAGGRGPEYFKSLFAELRAMGVAEWCVLNLGIVRGGAHHTGMVFEIHDAGGRGRSLAGGGRSEFERDGIVHAVGFDMGDTALLELLHEKTPAPDLRSLTEELGARTDVVVAAAEGQEALVATVAALRRAGWRSRRLDAPVTAVEELLKEARRTAAGGARHAVLIESSIGPGAGRVVDVSTGAVRPQAVPLDRLPELLRS
jgi:histidyl-tRNA synthetase